MEDINTKGNNINNYEIELSENFMPDNINKGFLDYSSIPSNYDEISNEEIKRKLNYKKFYEESKRKINSIFL